ncbi:MAG TPA: TonB-dependent receptor [Candidatus Angelobacter sp.]|nr:TonB-dependent receptor [Candidatus Angelobacter sp.]
MLNGKKLFTFFLVFAVLTLPAFSQERKGIISGRVTDSTGGVLKGAQITVDPSGANVVSDAQGQFFVNNLDPGSYTVTVTYVGFAKFTQTLQVAAGQVANLEAKLAVESQSLEVLVTAERPSAEAEAVNRERTADNIVQVLPADVIRSLPNANMADALGRLPSVTIERDEGEGKYVQVRGTEPRLTNTTIDGINVPSPESGVRQIKFDAIPADIVESVEINKTLQANMDGDGIGGSVNLVTKTAGERPTINLSGMGGYTPIQNGRGLIETTGTVGQRFGASKRIGVLIGGSYDWNGRGIDDTEPVPDIANIGAPSQARHFDAADIREYQYYRSRWGLAGSADYKPSDGSTLYIRGLYSDFHNYGDRWVYSLTDNTTGILLGGKNGCAVDPVTGLTTQPCTGVPSANTQQRRPDYAIGSLVLGGKHVLTTTWYAWDISVSRSSQVGQVGNNNAGFSATNLSTSNCQNIPSTTNIYIPQWSPACFTEAYNPSNYTLNDVAVNKGMTAQLNLQATGAMAKRYHLGSRLATIEIGGKFRNAHKFDNEYVLDWAPNAADISMTQFANRFTNNNYYGGAYKLGYNPSFPDIFSFVQANLSQFTATSTAGGNSANFDLIEKVSAGYVMQTLDISSRWRLIAGVRLEGTNLDTSSFQTISNCSVTVPANGTCPPADVLPSTSGFVKANGSYVKVLPSASVRYALTSNTNLRLAYGRGLSRPNPQDIAQAQTIDNTVNPHVVSLGNPNLKPEMADNVDVLVEYYINPFGMITAGYFYKNLVNPIVEHTCGPPITCPAPFAGDIVKQPLNAGSAWINGFEAAYLQHLSFLPGTFRGLGFSANYGYTASRASLGPDFQRSDHPRLLRNAPHTWNISPTYDRGRVSMRVGLSYNAANIAGYGFTDGAYGGIHGPFGDNYFYAHLQFDAQGSVRLTRGFSFVMYGLNINNEVFGFYNGSPQYMVQREYYRPTIAAGMRWSPLREK